MSSGKCKEQMFELFEFNLDFICGFQISENHLEKPSNTEVYRKRRLEKKFFCVFYFTGVVAKKFQNQPSSVEQNTLNVLLEKLETFSTQKEKFDRRNSHCRF